MRGTRGNVPSPFHRELHTVGLQRSWGCEPSTSYSTSNVGLQHIPARMPQRNSQHNLSFSLQSDRTPPSTSLTKRQPTATLQRQSLRENLPSLLGSISLSMLRIKPPRHKRKQAAASGISFEFSELHPSHNSTTCTAVRPASSNASVSASTLPPITSFELVDEESTYMQQPPFASMSSACASKIRKRKAPSIATDALATSAARQTRRQAAVQRPPLMQLAQGATTAISTALEEVERPNLAAARRELKRSAMLLPSNIRRLAAGAFAGALSKTLIAPIETIRMQVMGNKGTVVESIGRTWRRKGFFGFFSGNSADILRVMPSKAIELTAFDAYKKLLSHEDENGKLKRPGPLLTGLAGAAAGMTSTIGLYPLETLRTRLAMGDYDSLFHAVRVITAEEGFMAFYQGVQASLIGVLPYAAIRLGVYDGLKWSHRRFTKQQQIKPLPSMLYGAFAGLLSASATFPVEVVRRRMMVGTAKGSTFGALRTIAQKEGWRSLYKGIGLTWAKQAPQYAVTFLAYDLIKEILEV
ncbi:hypothetical protein ABBQ38_006136 [Trebouxia sp. C0009 RCD-2024]